MKPRVSPPGSAIGSLPRLVISRRLPQLALSGPDTVPEPNKSPARMLQPDDVAHVVEMLVLQAPGSFVSEVDLRPTQKP